MSNRSLNPVGDSDMTQLFVFELSDEDYAVEIDHVKEIKRSDEKEITPIPNVPKFIKGITNIRGQVVPVIDLEEKFDIPEKENKYIVILELHGATMGMLVDDVEEVMEVSNSRIKESPKILERKIHTNYMKGVAVMGDRLIIILDLEEGLEEEEAVKVKEISEEMSEPEEEEEEEDISEEELRKKARKKVRKMK